MCDYSLEQYRSRPAVEGAEYQTHRFVSGTVGFISAGDISTAVCMACDMRLSLEGIPEHVRQTFGVKASEVVTFSRLETGPHHDGVRFSNGREIALQQLGAGVKARVIDALTRPARMRKTAEFA